MLKENEIKISRGWKYKELSFDFNSKRPTEEENRPIKGKQICMFDK